MVPLIPLFPLDSVPVSGTGRAFVGMEVIGERRRFFVPILSVLRMTGWIATKDEGFRYRKIAGRDILW